MTMQRNNQSTEQLVDIVPCFVGICGSDLQKINSSSADAAFESIGHEIVAEYRDGLAAINPLIVCGQCENCKAGRTVFCSQLIALGRNQRGGFSGRVSVPLRNIHPIKLRNPSTGVLADPYAVVVHGLKDDASVSRIGILGDGILAQLSLLFYAFRPNGCGEICVIAKNRRRAKKLERVYGERFKDTSISVSFVGIEDAGSWSNAFELIIEAVGRAQSDTLNRAIAMVVPRGKIVSFGVYAVDYKANLSIRSLLYKEATLIGSNSFEPVDFVNAVSQIQSNEEAFMPLMGVSYDVGEWERAFDDARRKPSDLPQKVTIGFSKQYASAEIRTRIKGE